MQEAFALLSKRALLPFVICLAFATLILLRVRPRATVSCQARRCTPVVAPFAVQVGTFGGATAKRRTLTKSAARCVNKLGEGLTESN